MLKHEFLRSERGRQLALFSFSCWRKKRELNLESAEGRGEEARSVSNGEKRAEKSCLLSTIMRVVKQEKLSSTT